MLRYGSLAALAALLALSGCGKNEPTAVVAASPAPPASTASVHEGPASSTYTASGPVVVENQVDVAAQREGIVARILADIGTRVKRGQLLAQLDDRQLTADRNAARAKAKAIRADLQHWEAELKIRQSNLARAEAMWDARLITAQQVEHDRYEVAGAEYSIERQRGEAESAEAALRSLELELEKARILAPFDGVVARRYVRAGQEVSKGDRMFWVTATGPLEVKFTMPQEFIGKVKLGDELKVWTPPDASQRATAKVSRVSPVVDPSSGTIEVQARLVNPPAELRPGMTLTVDLNPR